MNKPGNIIYSTPVPKVARVVLNRVQARNAQSTAFLYELNDAFDRAAQDDDISVIVLAANGPHFSAGHDMREPERFAAMEDHRTVGTWCGFGCAGAEAQMGRERELYIGLSERWRNIAKPTIAEVHGLVISGGLMLVWPCDLIIAADDTRFIDNTVSMGVCGTEFFHHPWEVGARKAKEMLFTSEALSASEARQLGMVNHVVPRGELTRFTMELASRIARRPRFVLKLAKEAVNAAQDCQGRANALQSAFALHQLSHSHNQQIHQMSIDPSFFDTDPGRAVRRA